LTATAAGSSQINLSWGAATDNVAVTGYRIDRCQGPNCTSFSHLVQLSGTGTTYSDATLLPSTTYGYQVRAVDAAGNLGPVSNPAYATTAAGTQPTLVAAYGFEDGSGPTTADASGNGNNGTLLNVNWTTNGKFGDGLSFNGINARVDIPDASSLHLSAGMTLEAWVNPTTITTAWKDAVYKGNDNYYLMASSSNSGSLPVGGAIINGAHAEANGSAALPASTWTYLATTYDGSNVKLYVNGTLISSKPATGSIISSTNPLQIGGDSIYGQYFNGLIDEVRVYNAALSAGQIQNDMTTPVAVLPSAPTNLTASASDPTDVSVGWTASTSSVGISGYNIERCQGTGCSNFAQIGTSIGTTFQDTGLSANTTYRYRVRAVDTKGKTGPYSNLATAYTGLQMSPRAVALTPGETQQFTATLAGGGAATVTWSVDGVVGGSASTGTITAGGLYTAPASAGKHTVSGQAGTQTANADVYTATLPGVYKRSYDNMGSDVNASETVLSPANVNANTFGKLFSYPLDGVAYASPLYASNVAIPGQGTHEVVYVATAHDSVYAFDATGHSATPFWKDSFINPANGITTVPAADTGECCDIAPEIGISGTPVIDPATNTMYVVVKTKEVSGGTTNYVQRLHALDLSTGAEKFGGPVTITASVPGTGAGAVNGQVPFSPLRENQHTALSLINGVVYFGFSSHGDFQPYHGWIFGYTASTLQQTIAVNLTPNQEGAGVWMSGSGIVSDSTGNLYFITGDGEFDVNTGGKDYGDAYVRMTPNGAIADYFTPSNTDQINSNNFDLGSGSALLLPDQPGAHPHEMVGAGKDGTVYLVDRDNMGHFNATTNTNIQTLPHIFPNGTPEPGNYCAPVFYNGIVYFGPLNDTIQGFSLTNGLLSTSPTLRSSETYPDRGASVSVSANGLSSNGILWAVQRNGTSPGDLRAYDLSASGGGQLAEIYNSDQAGSRDTLGVAAKFVSPVVANGKVFVDGTNQLTVYGLLP
jgi:chitodextrinase